MKQEDDKSLSLHDIANYFDRSYQTIKCRLNNEWKGKLKIIKTSRTARGWRVDRAEFKRFLKELQQIEQVNRIPKCPSTTGTVSGTFNSISVDDALSARLGVALHDKRPRN